MDGWIPNGVINQGKYPHLNYLYSDFAFTHLFKHNTVFRWSDFFTWLREISRTFAYRCSSNIKIKPLHSYGMEEREFDSVLVKALLLMVKSQSQKSWNHRIIEYFGLEGAFRGHLAQHPCSEQGHLHLYQVSQSPVQPGLECFQGRDLHYLSRQLISVFHHPHCTNFLPYIESKSTLP